MHDPLILIGHVKPLDLDIWHREPGGHDSGEVCGYDYGRTAGQRAVFAVRHWRHLHLRWWPYLHIRRWIVERCDGCGRRFAWRESRCSYQSTDKVWHEPCMSLRHVRSQLDDLTGYVLCTADSNARWRAERRLKHIAGEQRDGSES